MGVFRYTSCMDDLLEKNEILKKMLDATLPVAEADPLGKIESGTYRVARSVLRKNIMRLQSIIVLNGYDKMSDSSLELVRNMIEDAISLGYILSDENLEEKANSFFQFIRIQDKQDIDYAIKLSPKITNELRQKRNQVYKDYRKVRTGYPKYFKDDNSPRHSWSEHGVDGMADILRKRRVYTKKEIRNMLRAYQLGSRKVHFNPHDLLNYYDQGVWDHASKKSLEISILGAGAGFTSIVVRYFDVIWHYDKNSNGKEIVQVLYDLLEQIHVS